MRDRLNIVFTTRDLQPDTPVIDESFHFVGPSIDANTRAQEMPVDALGAGPVIYISLGTVHADQLDFYRTCFEAFTDFKARFVMAVGKHVSLDSLGSVPANFLVRASVPQLELLQRTDVFITHGGINSVHEALYFGVPQILVPQQFEQLLNARQVAARGAGVVINARLRGEPIGAAVLREALATTMSDPRFKQAATELRASMRASGGYRQAADLLRAYAHASRL